MPACDGLEPAPLSPQNTTIPSVELLPDLLGRGSHNNSMSASPYTIPVDSTTGDLTGLALIKQQMQQQLQQQEQPQTLQQQPHLQQQQMLEDKGKTYASLEPAVNSSSNTIYRSKRSLPVSHRQNNTNLNIQDMFDWTLVQNLHDFKTWTMSHPESWNMDQILDWIYHVVRYTPEIQMTVQGEKFNSMTGCELCSLTREQFMALEPNYGAKLYEVLQQLLGQSEFMPPSPSQDDEPSPTPAEYPPSAAGCLPGIFSVLPPVNNGFHSNDQNNLIHCGSNAPFNQSTQAWPQQMPQQSNQHIPPYHQHPPGEDPTFAQQIVTSDSADIDGIDLDCLADISASDLDDEIPDFQAPDYSSGDSSSSQPPSPPDSPDLSDVLPALMPLQNPAPYLNNMPNFNTLLQQNSVHQTGTISAVPSRPQPRKRGRPRKERLPSENGGGSDGESQRRPNNRGRKHGQTTKCTHLWEFVRDLLKDPAYNPHLLKWEDKAEGVFRFVKSEKVAHLWGLKKNNPGMTYEKLSRAMRFCRTTNYFSEVPRNGKYPKKLCFRFGDKATGWQ